MLGGPPWHLALLSVILLTRRFQRLFRIPSLPVTGDDGYGMVYGLYTYQRKQKYECTLKKILNWFLREVTGTISDENFVKPHNDSSSPLTDFVSTTAPCRHQAIRNHYYTDSVVKCVTRDSYYETYIWQRTYSVAAIRLIRSALELER